MERYKVIFKGLTPLLMHKDNLMYTEKIKEWRKDPANKELSAAGDDRSPAWTWIGYVYHDTVNLGVDADNIMTMLREGGAKIKTGKGQETYKKQTQSGILIDQQQFDLILNGGSLIPIDKIEPLIGNINFKDHVDVAEQLGFELFVKRAKVGQSKHIRVRPFFRHWELRGSITVIDEELSGITEEILSFILNQAGALCGLCDWRPNTSKGGSFGKFEPSIKKI